MIDDDLNIVLPLRESEDGPLSYIYHTPISKEVFKANYRALAAVKSELASKGTEYQMLTGPQIAALAMRDEMMAQAMRAGDVDESGEPNPKIANAFFAELARLTTVIVPTNTGWQKKPVDAAVRDGDVDEDEWEEMEAALVFFTSHYWLMKKAKRAEMADATASLLEGFVTSSPISECRDFLPTLMNAETSEPKEASSAPV